MSERSVWTFIKDFFRATWDRLTNAQRVQETFPDSYDQSQDAKKIETVFFTIRSDKDVDFDNVDLDTDGELDDADLTGLSSNKIRIKAVRCQCDVLFSFDVLLWSKDTKNTADPDTDSQKGIIRFLTADGFRCETGTSDQYRYESGPIDIPYEDLDGTFELHCSICWRGGADKLSTDEFILEVDYEPAS